MLSIAVLDDDAKYLREYERKIPQWFDKNSIEGSMVIATTNANEFLTAVNKSTVNVCIIDINLKTDVNGMYIAKLLRKEGNHHIEIIFMTGFLEYMQQAFDVQAYNFIQKPGWSQLEKCMVNLSREINQRQKVRRKTIDIKCGSMIYYLSNDDIYYLEHIGNKTVLNCNNGYYSTYEGLEEIVLRLDDSRFLKCHRSIFVNSDYISSFDIKNKVLLLSNGFKCEVGPKYYKLFNSKDRSEALYLMNS